MRLGIPLCVRRFALACNDFRFNTKVTTATTIIFRILLSRILQKKKIEANKLDFLTDPTSW